MKQPSLAFWSVPAAEFLKELQTTPQGLSDEEAQERLARHGSNLLKPKKRTDDLTLLLSQFKNPIILILLFAVGISILLHDSADALIILFIVLVSGLLGFWQERGAVNAVEKLLAIVQIKATVIRDGGSKEVPVEEIVPGDIRTPRPFYQSRPGKYLLTATLLIAGATLTLPFSPLGGLFKFRPLPAPFFIALGAIVVLHIIAAEIAKRVFYRKIKS